MEKKKIKDLQDEVQFWFYPVDDQPTKKVRGKVCLFEDGTVNCLAQYFESAERWHYYKPSDSSLESEVELIPKEEYI